MPNKPSPKRSTRKRTTAGPASQASSGNASGKRASQAKPCEGTKTERKAVDAGRTKASIILDLLQRPTGASIAELTKATGWQPHSVRAALTGLRKKGRDVVRTKDDKGVTRYATTAGSGS